MSRHTRGPAGVSPGQGAAMTPCHMTVTATVDRVKLSRLLAGYPLGPEPTGRTAFILQTAAARETLPDSATMYATLVAINQALNDSHRWSHERLYHYIRVAVARALEYGERRS